MKHLIGLAVLLAGSPAWAGDGGDIPWANKANLKDEKQVAALFAKKEPKMIYFTSDG